MCAMRTMRVSCMCETVNSKYQSCHIINTSWICSSTQSYRYLGNDTWVLHTNTLLLSHTPKTPVPLNYDCYDIRCASYKRYIQYNTLSIELFL